MNYKHPIYIKINYKLFFLKQDVPIFWHIIWNKMEVISLGHPTYILITTYLPTNYLLFTYVIINHHLLPSYVHMKLIL